MVALRVALITIFLSLTATACRQRLHNPELQDPVFQDIKKDADTTYSKITQAQKDLEKAKQDYKNAPDIRGVKEDARDNYFKAEHDLENLIEKYRYLALKVQMRLKYDRQAYEIAFKTKRPWPDMQSYFEYETEKRLAEAPREWNPENRIKKRHPAGESKPKTESGD